MPEIQTKSKDFGVKCLRDGELPVGRRLTFKHFVFEVCQFALQIDGILQLIVSCLIYVAVKVLHPASYGNKRV